MADFKWGILGPGRIARKFIECIHQLKGSTLHAIASQSSKDLKGLQESLHAEKAYSSYEELVRDEDVQAVYIATPHRFHYANASLCLMNGKPAVVEKPVTVNRIEFQRVVDLSEEKNIFVMEAMWTRFLPVFRQIKTWLDAGEIGNPELVISAFGFKAPRNLEDRWLNPQLAGGAVLDLSVYNVAATQMVFGKIPKVITAEAVIGPTGVDEMINAKLEYEDGGSARFMSTLLARPFTSLQIWGSRGNILTETPFNSSEKATMFNKSGETIFEENHKINGFEYQILEAQRCIEAGLIESPLMTHKDSLDDLQIMDEIRQQIGLHYPFETR
jgi:predicted dehydrogenase